MNKRSLYVSTWKDLSSSKSMLFLSGPRQSGKTTLSEIISENYPNHLYFNWDEYESKKKLTTNPSFFTHIDRKDASKPLIIFDEIHKYRRWKNYLKGAYDQFKKEYQFLILGSGRLNVFQKGGDSLAGRYFLFRLFPFTLAELSTQRREYSDFIKDPFGVSSEKHQKNWDTLSKLSGFPEPFLSGKETTYRRWSKTYGNQLIREDIRNITEVKRIDDVETLYALLPSKVGNPLSLHKLAQDIQVSFTSIRNWCDIFDSFFLTFRISPWTKKVARAITKEKKLYLYNYALIESPSVRFENMVALELLRAVSNWNDLGLGDYNLHYIRNKEKEEVDFLLTNNNRPFLLIEAKLAEDVPSKSIRKFQTQFNIPAIQLVNKTKTYRLIPNGSHRILVVTASQWVSTLP